MKATRICIICGREFECEVGCTYGCGSRFNKKTCSKECANALHDRHVKRFKMNNHEKVLEQLRLYWSNNRWRFRNNNRVCKLCGKPIYLSKDQETTRDQMHDICVYDDVIKTLLKGETLSSTQRSRLNHLGYTVTAFKKDYASEIKKG